MLKKFRLDITCAMVFAVLPGLLIWFKGESLFGLASVEQRAGWIVGLCVAFVMIVSLCGLAVLARPAVGMRRIGNWVADFIKFPMKMADAGSVGEVEFSKSRIVDLKFRLQEAHGWKWRRRDRWLLLCGEAHAIDQVAPTLRRDGWALTPQALLLYSGKPGSDGDAGEIPHAAWLKKIAALRRRPVDAVVTVIGNSDGQHDASGRDLLAHQFYLQSRALGWAAPAYVMHVNELDGAPPKDAQAIGCGWSKPFATPSLIDKNLLTLCRCLAEQGIDHLKQQLARSGMAQLSRNIETQASSLSRLVTRLQSSRLGKIAIHGIFFAPVFKVANTNKTVAASSVLVWQYANWQAIADHSRQLRGRRVGWSTSTLAACACMGLLALWMIGSLISSASNHQVIDDAKAVITRLQGAQTPVAAARDLDQLQQQLGMLEQRQQHGAPLRTRFGLNHEAALLRTLWPHYQTASQRILSAPLQRQLEAELQQRNALSDQALADSGEAQVKAAYADLKTYLMLAQPQYTDVDFLNAQWLASGQPLMPSQSEMTHGSWYDLRQRMIRFHVNHLARHAPWAITPEAVLVDNARQALTAVIGLQNSTDVVYQSILDEHAGKYPALSLQNLLGNTSSRGLFSIQATVPGVFTKAAWDERISKAIDQADRQRNSERDWVLADSGAAAQMQADRDLKQALRQRYFADYARAWELFLNSAQWHGDDSLSGTIDQLTLLADAQRSPLLALFNAVTYQASAGTTAASLAESLVNKAQQLVQSKLPDPAKMGPLALEQAPLRSAFDPLLRLHQSSTANATAGAAAPADLSLARYLERITAVRLKLQQIMMSRDPEAMSRNTAQAILQGKTSDLADSRDYASRVGASLGKQWSGFGHAVFERPLEQTLNVVLQPAAANLNAIWRSAIVAAWNDSFGGRYPFAEVDNDASLPELARFLRRDGGLIAQFVEQQLSGILERQGDHWIATQADGGRQLQLDPEFIAALNQLTRISNRLFAEGDARVRFELKPFGTGSIADMRLINGEQKLHYANHHEQWQAMAWPGTALSGATQLQWESEHSGLRAELGATGRFGLIRLLGQATVTQVDGAQYQLVWQSAQGTEPLRMLLRSEVGAGPLEVLTLRGFRLPQRVFVMAAAGTAVGET